MVERRGRPSEQPAVKLDKWVLETNDTTYHYDVNKNPNGPWKTINHGTTNFPKPEINQRPYGKNPVVMVFKTSNRSNAKIKMKVFRKNIDYILTAKKLPGVPEKSIILDLGVGTSFINKYKQKYNLA
jgi:hypothetical protein